MSRSGRVGRVTAVYPHHQDVVITDDLLRVVPKDADEYGWIYAYMRTPTFGAMAETSKYGHMIMPRLPARRAVSDLAVKALSLRQDAMRILHNADQMYEQLISPDQTVPVATVSHSVPISRLLKSRRRLDAEFARADVLSIEELIRHAGTHPVQTVDDVCSSVTLGSRFRRYFGPTGTPYRSASELLDLNAPVTKRVYAALVPDKQEYILRAGWIIMACSGQVYGINGRCMLLTSAHDGIFGSHDLIRLVPDTQRIHPGYLQLALNNRRYGRPLVIRHAYGTSIPHLDPIDIRTVPIARFDDVTEKELGSLVVRAAVLSSQADELENKATAEAEKMIHRFVRSGPE